MRDVAAIVEPAIDRDKFERAIHAKHIAIKDSDAKLEKSEKRLAADREESARHRLEMGRMLAEYRKTWPARGPKAKGWGEFLARQGITQQNAHNWMSLAGYVEISQTEGGVCEIPTVREVNAARYARQEASNEIHFPGESRLEAAPDPAEDWRQEVESRRAEKPVLYREVDDEPQEMPDLDINRELSRVQDKVFKWAAALPSRFRRMVAHELHQTARRLEEMK